MLNLTIAQKRLALRYLGAGIVGILVSSFGFFEKDVSYSIKIPIYGFVLGYGAAFVELIIIRKLETQNNWLNIGYRLLFHSSLLIIVHFYTTIIFEGFGWYDMEESRYDMLNVFGRSFFIITFIIVFIRIEAIIGVGFVQKILIGYYRKPKREYRYFFFADLNDSTGLNERLGDQKYYAFLNRFFKDMSAPIFKSGGVIYKYVGDEIIVTWEKNRGDSVADRAYSLYKDLKRKLKEQESFYLKEFGEVPSFKSGLHCGLVVAAQVGDLKKEIAYNGNVVNTTARLVSWCKDFQKGLLISERVFENMENKPEYALEICDLVIEGSQKNINVYGID